jgi:nucleoside-diphosphate-sugar epimerase
MNDSFPNFNLINLQKRIVQQKPSRPFFENIAILGCGYVGTKLAEYWTSAGQTITVTTTSQNRITELSKITPIICIMKGDNEEMLHSLLYTQDVLVVCIAPTGNKSVDALIYEKIYLNTANAISKVIKSYPNIKQIIYISSCGVYGNHNGNWVTESTIVQPLNQKDSALYEAERVFLELNSPNLKTCVFRLGGIYGPNRELLNMIGGMSGMTLPGKGDRYINWIHLDDIVQAIEFARVKELEGIYNLVDDSYMTLKEQCQLVHSEYNLEPIYWDSSLQSKEEKSLRVSNEKLKRVGYRLKHPYLVI